MDRDSVCDNKIPSILLHDILSNAYSVSRMVLKSTYSLYITHCPRSPTTKRQALLEHSTEELLCWNC